MAMNLGATSKKATPTPNVNVTPLVDVALVVLIIFMMVTPLTTKTFWLNLPQKEEKEAPPPPPNRKNEPLVMTVDEQGVIRVNQTVLRKEEIGARLPRMLAAKGQKILYFDAHDRAPYGRAVEAMDLSRGGGARSIAILTKPIVK